MLRTPLVRSARATRRPALFAGLGLAASLLFAAGSASATPLYFTGTLGIGTTAAEVAAAQADDPGLIPTLDLDSPLPGLGLVEFSGAGGATSAFPDCVDEPGNPDCIALRVTTLPLTFPRDDLPDPPFDYNNPIEATSEWTVVNSTGQDLLGAFLIFSGTLGALSGDPALVGLEAESSDDYVLMTKDLGGAVGVIYTAAVELGPLTADGDGAEATVMVHYRVADDLIPAGPDDLFLPVLKVAAIVVPVPEPAAFSLFATGLVVLAAMRRRRCD